MAAESRERRNFFIGVLCRLGQLGFGVAGSAVATAKQREFFMGAARDEQA